MQVSATKRENGELLPVCDIFQSFAPCHTHLTNLVLHTKELSSFPFGYAGMINLYLTSSGCLKKIVLGICYKKISLIIKIILRIRDEKITALYITKGPCSRDPEPLLLHRKQREGKRAKGQAISRDSLPQVLHSTLWTGH